MLSETKTLSEYIKAGGEPDSSANQRIRDQLVSRNVLLCCSGLVASLGDQDLSRNPGLEEVICRPDYDEAVQEWIRDYASVEDLVGASLIDEPPDPDEDDVQIEEKGDTLRKVAARNASRLSTKEARDLCGDFDVLNRSSTEPIEALEHWVVDRYFAEKLKDHVEMVSNDIVPDGWYIWGRATSGQAISMDHVIAEIAAEMQILVGQAYQWGSSK